MSDDERLELDKIIASSDEYKKLYEDLTDPNKLFEEIVQIRSWDGEASWKKTESEIFPKTFPVWKFIAAAVVLVLITGVGYKYFSNSEHKEQYAQVYNAQLKTGKGQVINLNKVGNGRIDTARALPLIKNDSQLVYPNAPVIPNPETDTLATPRSARFQVLLPDGSKVWLNNTSTIYFPSSFSATERWVFVEGEAYFDIAKDPSRPFKIITPGMEIQVTGTRFNLKAYKDEEISTTLFEGSVKIQAGQDSATLKPGEQAVLTKGKKLRKVKDSIAIKKARAWRQGDFVFHGDDLKAVMEELGRSYDYDVEYKGPLSDRKYTGEFVRSEPLRDILDMFQTLSGYKITINGKKIIVDP